MEDLDKFRVLKSIINSLATAHAAILPDGAFKEGYEKALDDVINTMKKLDNDES